MSLISRILWPSSVRRRVLVALCAMLAALGLTLAFSNHLLVYALRVKAADLFAADPEIALAFERVPADRPVLGSGTAETPMIVMDSCVLADSEGYHLFFSSFFCDTPNGLSPFWKPEFGEQFNILKLPTGIAYAFSDDRGMTWNVRPTPVLLPDPQGWDSYRVETASVVVVDDVMHLFYCADEKQKPARYQIGEASLALQGKSLRNALLVEGASPSRNRTTPLLAGVRDKPSFRNNAQEPSVLFVEEQFELYFVGLQLSEPAEAIDHPRQSIRRVGLGRALLDRSLNVIEVSDQPLLDLANIIEMKRTDDGFILFTVLAGEGNAHKRERIGYHTSRDGRSWSRAEPIIASLPTGFDSWGCMSPTVVRENDRWVLFYTALENMPKRPQERWGLSMGNDGWLFGTLGRAEAVVPREASRLP